MDLFIYRVEGLYYRQPNTLNILVIIQTVYNTLAVVYNRHELGREPLQHPI